MALIDRVQRWRPAWTKAADTYPPWALETAAAERHNLPSLEYAANQANLYQKLGWVNAAVNAVARAVALEPLSVYRLQGEQREDVDNHPFEVLLRRPNPLMSRYELIFATVAWRKLTGNAYWWLSRSRDNAAPDEIWLIPSRRIEPVPDGRMYLKGYVYDPGDGTKLPLEPWEVVHFRGFHPANDFVGASDIESFSWTAQGDHAMAQWNARFFDQDNAKFPGVLAFADPIPDSAWELMKREFNEAHGGARRHMRMMRNVGAGGVQWIQTSMAQKDMEFLNGREFNRDEIFAIMAPGLASVLAVNATEANATAGKSTLMEHAVWPEMVAIAEKVTNDLLTAYGPNLVAEFDDPRVMDRALELEERKVWQQVHTVDEVREHYDGDDPVGDERGALLVPQVDKLAGKPEIAQDAPLQLTAGGGGSGPVAAPAEETPVEEQVPEVPATRAAELATWRRYARKHGAVKAAAFTPDHLPRDVSAVIASRLAAATDAEEVDAAFSGPFLIKASRVTEDGTEDPNAEAKERAERRLVRILRERLDGQLQGVLNLLGEPPDTANLTAEFWVTEAAAMIADLRPEMERYAQESGERLIVEQGIGIDWALAAEAAARWAEQRAGELIRGVTEVNQRLVRENVARFLRTPGMTVGQLRDSLTPYFGERRAQTIAVTETTRAFAEGEYRSVQLAQLAGFNLVPIWHTSSDELVCPQCGPLNGQPSERWAQLSPGIDVSSAPPRHVNCRCWVTHEWAGETG